MIPPSEKTFGLSKENFSFKDALEVAPIGVLIFSKDFRVEFVNSNFFKFAGVVEGTPDLLIGKSIYEYRIFQNVDLRKDLIELKNLLAFEKELADLQTLSGNKISILLKCVPIILNNEFQGGIIILEDIKYAVSKTDIPLISSQNFQNFLSLISDCFFFVDREGNIKSFSTKGYRESSLRSPSSVRTPIEDMPTVEEYDFLFEPDSFISSKRPQKLSGIIFKKLLEQAITKTKTICTEIPFLKNSKEQKAAITIIPLAEGENKVETLIVLVSKSDYLRNAENIVDEEIKELQKYEYVASNLLDGLIGINKEGKIYLWNEGSAKLFGLTKSEVYGKFIGKVFPQMDETFLVKIKEELSEKTFWEGQFKIGEDESIAEYYSIRIGLLKDNDEENYILLCTNITQKAKVEENLRRSEEKFRNIVINSHEFILILDLTGKITYANPYFLEVFKYTEEEITRLFFSDLIDSYFLMNVGFNLKDIRNSKMLEIPLTTKSGQKVYTLASFSIVRDLSDTPLYYNVILTDITLKKESEKDLLLIRSLFEASHDGIAIINKRKLFLVNDSFVKMFGYRNASEVIGQDPLNFVHNNDIVTVGRFIQDLEEGKNTLAEGTDSHNRFVFTGITKSNTTIYLENSVSSYEVENEKFIVWVLRDITVEKKAQEALQLSEERYRSITENINESIWTAERIDGKLKEVFYTPAIKKITGYSPESFLSDPLLWKKIIHPDDVNETISKMHKLYNDPARTFDTLEYRIIDALGNVIWIENKITVKRDANGEITKIFGIINDITLSKRAEEELKKSAQELKELNEAKDRFISIISHDLRTPFSSILGFTDFLLNEKDLPEEKRIQYVQFIQESAKSMLSLVNSLLDWTRLQTGRIKFEPQRINGRLLVDKSIQMLAGAALQKGVNLFSEIDKDFYIHADENLLMQAFNNLISNAIKFTNAGGQISVSANADVVKRHVQFSIKDNGIGIRKEDLPKLFKVDTKFTTIGTAGERGSGLGLSLVREIVQKHGGEIWVESEFGKGSEFIFTIPVSSTSILLVDDIRTDRILYSKLIKSLISGYSIIEAENGKHALEIVKQSSPALVITDHKMPVMNGYDFVKQLQISDLKYRPPVIVLSSDINSIIEEEYKNLGVEFIFQKPVNLSSFKNAIEKSLRKAIFA